MVELVKQNRLFEYGIDLQGSVIFHTAVSPAGVGPTSSNKLEIESSIPPLSAAGVKLHLGKGALSVNTIHDLDQYGSVYAVIPPVTALLGSENFEQTVVAFPEEGMEAFYRLKVDGYPALIAADTGSQFSDYRGIAYGKRVRDCIVQKQLKRSFVQAQRFVLIKIRLQASD